MAQRECFSIEHENSRRYSFGEYRYCIYENDFVPFHTEPAQCTADFLKTVLV